MADDENLMFTEPALEVAPAPTNKPFLPQWSETGWTRLIAGFAIVLLTLSLAALNVSGAWIASNNVFYTIVICGVEILAATTLVLVLAAPTWPRKIVGGVCMGVIICIAVANGQISVSNSFAGKFKDEKGALQSADALRKQADIADTDASALKTSDPVQRNTDAEELAKLKTEQDLLSSPNRTKEAQTHLMALGYNTGKTVDGIDDKLTAEARKNRGDIVAKRIGVLTEKLAKSETPSSERAIEAVNLRSRADDIDGGYRWLYMLLIGVELARTAGYWAFVAWSDQKPQVKVDPNVFRTLQEQADELARRKANLEAGAEKGVKKRTRNKKADAERLRIADMSAQLKAREEAEASGLDEDIHPGFPAPEEPIPEEEMPHDALFDADVELNEEADPELFEDANPGEDGAEEEAEADEADDDRRDDESSDEAGALADEAHDEEPTEADLDEQAANEDDDEEERAA